MKTQILARKERDAREAVFPDLRNVGILARALMLYMAMVFAYALSITTQPYEIIINITVVLAGGLPVAALVGASWALLTPWLRRLAYWQATTVLIILTFAVATMAARMTDAPAWRTVPLALLGLMAILIYFHTLGRALSPAVTEARLQALQARIRPHFLFNSINGVLGVLRADPKRAETALEDMADLFRVLMRENRDLQPLADEIMLTRQYLNLEKMRLGDRLNVLWKLDKMPTDAVVPPLVLQPIAENAVYHKPRARSKLKSPVCAVRSPSL
jgi:two-component system, LytTR family, sensor histidine kinase AlgZ